MNHTPKSRILLCFLAAAIATKAAAQQPSFMTLAAGPNPSTLSAPVTLEATVSPAAATGKVTFYDGTAILGLASLDTGRAILTTRLLPSGNRTLRARYWGNATFSPSVSAPVRQTVNAKAGFGHSRAPGSPFPTGTHPFFAAMADFNGDGKPDLALLGDSGEEDTQEITVLLNNGKGGFAAPPTSPFAVGITAFTIGVGDFNADGKPDVVVPNVLNDSLTVWLGDGAGGFKAGGTFPTENLPVGIVVADFNGDGMPDVAVTNYHSDSVTILLGNGSGGFHTPGASFDAGSGPIGLAAADFNGDGNPDLAVVADDDNDRVTILLGNGSGQFSMGQSFPMGKVPPDVIERCINNAIMVQETSSCAKAER